MAYASQKYVKELLKKVLEKAKDDELLGGGNPTGTIISFMGTKAPNGYLSCDGAVLNISDYPKLAEFITEQFDSVNHFGGDGTTTFAVPDLRGEFLRGTGTNSHENSGNGADVGVHQEPTMHSSIMATEKAWTMVGGDSRNLAPGQHSSDTIFTAADAKYNKFVLYGGNNAVLANTSDYTSEYTSRPTNTSVLYCIKY